MSTHRLTFALLGIIFAVWPVRLGWSENTVSFSASGSGRVQESCAFNTDCLSGMYCNSGFCACLSTYVAAEGYCYQKIEPGQPGCVYDEQCSAVWPEAKCDMAGVGTCRCGEFKVEKATRDGHVCLDIRDMSGNALAITCPLPEGAGYTSALSDASHPRQPSGAGPVLCNTESTVVSQTIGSEEIGDGSAACLFPSDNTYLVDLYDCIGFVSQMDLSSAGFSSLANGICCPNRAFTCIQPTSTGPNPTEPRWWYNSVTGMCQQFLWDPTATGVNDHSPNNFRTVEHCESYCRDACSRGSPEYDVRMTIVEESPLNGCLQAPSCSANYECKTIGSLQWCCPTVTSICGPTGGRPDDPVIFSRGTIYHSGLIKPGSTPATRFFYDPDHGRCIPFTYYGAGGNYNNFLSRIDCELFCSKLQCERGNPLRIGEVTQSCQTNVDCPSSHECKTEKSVCCPRQQTICTQQLRVGNCDRSVRRFWYNAATRECQSFDYTGCQGNDNNFDTLMDCQNFCRNASPEPRCPQGQAYKDQTGKFLPCSKNGMGAVCPSNHECLYDGQFYGCCPTKTYTCSLAHSSGVTCGSGVSYKFYYNAPAQDCESFLYNGCDGNSNNFATRAECESYCGVGGCPNGGAPLREGNGMLVSCSTDKNACPSSHECHPVTIGSSIANRCCPTRAHICSLPPQQGSSSCTNGLVSKTRYYFNIVTRQCTPFSFHGCDGNNNNFETQTQCSNFCHAAACSAGDVVFLNPNNQEPINCNDEMRNSCPANYHCTYDSLSDKHVCCGATDMGVCPEGEKAYINAVDMSVRECLVNVRGSCPLEYLCRFNPQKNRYYCCGSRSKVYCPVGRVAFKDHLTIQPIRCTMGVIVDGCPQNYVCMSNITGALQGYCCSENDVCPNKEEFFVDSTTQMPRSCSIGQIVTCPSGYSCQAMTKGGADGFCCKINQNSASDGCPPGNYVYQEGNTAVTCDPFNSRNNGCPTGYSCQWSGSLQRYQCCGTEAPPKPSETRQAADGCPALQIAYQDPVTQKPKTCTSATFSCPTGYFCQFSSVNRQFQCCGMNAGCPNKQVAFIGMNGDAQQCQIGGTLCSPGFSCQRSENSKYICCTTTITPCITSQVLVGGVCLDRITIGGSCVNQVQCLGGSQCQNGICVCPAGTYQESGACLSPRSITCDPTQIKVANGCLNLVPIGRPCTNPLQCQRDSVCQDGFCVCPTNKININDQCVPIVGGSGPSVSTTTSSGTSSVVAPTIPPPITPKPTITTIAQVLSINFTFSTVVTATVVSAIGGSTLIDVCPNGALAYIKNGEPLLCMNGVTCPLGFTCTFSKTSSNYYCCAAQKSSTAGMNGCPRGTPLIFPQTQQPVACTAFHRCPSGYSCVQSTTTRLYQCCTTQKPVVLQQYGLKVSAKELQPFYAAVTKRKETSELSLALLNKGPALKTRPICPSYLVYVELQIDGKTLKRCESSCPSNMTPIQGICQVPPKSP